METVITTIIIVGVLVLAIVGLAQSSLSAQTSIAQSSGAMQERAGDRARTNLLSLYGRTTPLGDYVELTLRNSGSTKLSNFNQWDVVLQYSDGASTQVKWYPYGSAVNQWNQQIYLTASPPVAEVFEPGIFNPGEEMVITVGVSPKVGTGTTNIAVVATPNGITASTVYTH
jgi:hypothetical protein